MWKSFRSQNPKSRFPYPRGRAALLALPLVGLLSALIFFQSPDPKPAPPPPRPATGPSAPSPEPTPPPEPEPAPVPVLEEGCPEGCTAPQPDCAIKGNTSVKTGERIYHLPGQEFYDKTVIEPEKGERWFCTEKEAKANGWRKTKR